MTVMKTRMIAEMIAGLWFRKRRRISWPWLLDSRGLAGQLRVFDLDQGNELLLVGLHFGNHVR